MAGENFEGHSLLGLVAAMGSRGFSLANFKILLRELSEMFSCSLILFRGMPAPTVQWQFFFLLLKKVCSPWDWQLQA
jgi:hypothetical protein